MKKPYTYQIIIKPWYPQYSASKHEANNPDNKKMITAISITTGMREEVHRLVDRIFDEAESIKD